MSIRLQLVDHQSNALPPGLELTLLENGQEIAKGTTDGDGVVAFDVEAATREGLSVRFDAWPALQEGLAKVLAQAR